MSHRSYHHHRRHRGRDCYAAGVACVFLVVIVRCLVGGKGRKVLNKTGTTPSPVSRCYLSVTSTRW